MACSIATKSPLTAKEVESGNFTSGGGGSATIYDLDLVAATRFTRRPVSIVRNVRSTVSSSSTATCCRRRRRRCSCFIRFIATTTTTTAAAAATCRCRVK